MNSIKRRMSCSSKRTGPLWAVVDVVIAPYDRQLLLVAVVVPEVPGPAFVAAVRCHAGAVAPAGAPGLVGGLCL